VVRQITNGRTRLEHSLSFRFSFRLPPKSLDSISSVRHQLSSLLILSIVAICSLLQGPAPDDHGVFVRFASVVHLSRSRNLLFRSRPAPSFTLLTSSHHFSLSLSRLTERPLLYSLLTHNQKSHQHFQLSATFAQQSLLSSKASANLSATDDRCFERRFTAVPCARRLPPSTQRHNQSESSSNQNKFTF
jgi:hypothetical protein